MKRFLIHIFLLLAIPVIILACIYVITDPFKTLKPFSLDYFDDTNRDYLSTELFLMNDSIYHYDSFVLGSSRCGGINTYHWKKYLPEGSSPFLFQSWGETITGIGQKLSYLDKSGTEINNALVLIDIPSSFARNQQSKDPLFIHSYKVTGQSWLGHQICLFRNFMGKPSVWIKSIKSFLSNVHPPVGFDVVTNDWDGHNKERDLDLQPAMDSLKICSAHTRDVFFKSVAEASNEQTVSDKLITDQLKHQLLLIKDVFDKHHTNYMIIITPAYCYTHPTIHPDDLNVLIDTFGAEYVYDYSGVNEISSNCYHFSDPNHFDLSAGWKMIEEIYNPKAHQK